jgi:tol-pal system protein YbgF
MERKDRWILAIAKKPGPKIEGPIPLSLQNNDRWHSSGSAEVPRGEPVHPKNFKKGDGMKRWIVFLIGLLLFGCASSKDVRMLDKEMDKLYSQINALKRENDFTRNDLSDLRAENQRLKSDLSLRLENIQSEMQSLTTDIEEYKEMLKRPSKDMDRVREDMEARLKTLEERRRNQEEKIRELEERLKAPEPKTPPPGPKPLELEKSVSTKETPTELKGSSTGIGDLYKDAYETFHKGDLEGSRRKFEAFLKQYPNTELSDNAQFWIGETYYLKKDYERAIIEYEKAIVKYPEGDKIPAAIFKQALSFLELNDKTNARTLFKRVIEKYPRSDQAEMARKRLETIK